MNIFITGGTGFVGASLSRSLVEAGHRVTATGTRPQSKASIHQDVRYIRCNTTQDGEWRDSLKHMDAVINLAGKSIFTLWTPAAKQRIYDSRILTTRLLAESIPQDRDVVFLSTSAAGYYGDCGDRVLTEESPKGRGFLTDVCEDWESEALSAGGSGVRVVIMRFGVVLGKGGGALKKMIPAFRFFLGGPIGDGNQWFPWIHIDDLISAVMFLLENRDSDGPFNFTGPSPVRQIGFASALGDALNRPAFMPAPAFLIRTVGGEFGESLLASQKVYPERLMKASFQFSYEDVRRALSEITGNYKA